MKRKILSLLFLLAAIILAGAHFSTTYARSYDAMLMSFIAGVGALICFFIFFASIPKEWLKKEISFGKKEKGK